MGWVDLDLRCSTILLGQYVATVSAHQLREHLKSKSTQPNPLAKTSSKPTFFDYLAIFIHPNQVKIAEEDCNTSESSMLSSAATNDADCGSVHTFSALPPPSPSPSPPLTASTTPIISENQLTQPQTHHLTPHPYTQPHVVHF